VKAVTTLRLSPRDGKAKHCGAWSGRALEFLNIRGWDRDNRPSPVAAHATGATKRKTKFHEAGTGRGNAPLRRNSPRGRFRKVLSGLPPPRVPAPIHKPAHECTHAYCTVLCCSRLAEPGRPRILKQRVSTTIYSTVLYPLHIQRGSTFSNPVVG
jgi:hypothetical protein